MRLKRCMIMLLTVMIACVLSACHPSENKPAPETTKAPVTAVSPKPDDSQTTEEPTLSPKETKEIVIYTLNSETLRKEAVTALVYVESELTPELIMEQVVDAMEDEFFYIEIDGITTEDKHIVISFCKESIPVCNVGAETESAMLDAIGQSLLDNLPAYSGVIYRVEGGAYESGHINLGMNEVFISR